MTWAPDNARASEMLKRLDDADGFITVTLRDLKVMMNVERLGKIVLADIKRWLDRNGVGYFPKEAIESNAVPRQDQSVRLYRNDRASGLAAVVTAVLDPSAEGDEVLSALLRDSGTQRAEEMEERIARTKAALEDALREVTGGAEA